MKFLVDNQLPLALSRALAELGFDCEHVFELGMARTSDVDIWQYAISKDRVLITKDEDFVRLVNAPANAGKLIWVRLGNCRNEVLIAAIVSNLVDIIDTLELESNIVELR